MNSEDLKRRLKILEVKSEIIRARIKLSQLKKTLYDLKNPDEFEITYPGSESD